MKTPIKVSMVKFTKYHAHWSEAESIFEKSHARST